MGWVPPGHTSSFECVMLKMPNMVLLKKQKQKTTWTQVVKPTNIYLEVLVPVDFLVCLYGYTPSCVRVGTKIKTKNDTWARHSLEATDLSINNFTLEITWVGSHLNTSLTPGCVRLKTICTCACMLMCIHFITNAL